MAQGDAREGNWTGDLRIEFVASTLHTSSEHGVSSITTADAHTSAASSRMNWRPHRFKWTRPFRRNTKSGFCACAITFRTQSTFSSVTRPATYKDGGLIRATKREGFVPMGFYGTRRCQTTFSFVDNLRERASHAHTCGEKDRSCRGNITKNSEHMSHWVQNVPVLCNERLLASWEVSKNTRSAVDVYHNMCLFRMFGEKRKEMEITFSKE